MSTYKFKIDENLPQELADLLRASGCDAETVWSEGMQGVSDALLIEQCKRENRVLVTVDIGFADIRKYKPKGHPGIIVLRVRDQSRQSMIACFKKVLPALPSVPLAGLLWIVDERRIRLRGLTREPSTTSET
ncbi:DUF5615 family PIN-like protein [Desulforudis sp. 1088]|uniref:DUF5615 family PIN-like protein n=1 Tax=unclassified Candidatus Desulforudis TaxID=2635950 RepID=UPI003CE54A02